MENSGNVPLETEALKQLWREATDARKRSYCPYSHFAVGAALLCGDGSIVTGCNVENAAYGPSICAERTAVVKAVSEGKKGFQAIAIAGGPREGELKECYPCGVCRQVLSEFVDPEHFLVVCGSREEELEKMSLSELLPRSFSLEKQK